MVNEARISWSQATSDAVQQPYGLFPPAAATIPGSVTDPTVAGGLPGITIDGFFGGSGLGRIGSPDFLPKFQHTNQVEYLDTLSWLRGNHAFKVGADIIAPMQNHYMDVPATRGSLRFRNALHRQPDGRLPARLRLGPAALERLDRRAAPPGVDVLRAGRLEGELEAVGEPRPALRLHHAGSRGQQPPDELRPGGRRLARIRRATGRSKSAGSSSRTATTGRRGSARPTSSPTTRSSAAAGASSTTSSIASAARISWR